MPRTLAACSCNPISPKPCPVVSGWGLADLPAGSVGFLYLPAVAALAACTVLFAPLGVRAAHRLPADVLKAALGLLMFVIASQMLLKLVAA